VLPSQEEEEMFSDDWNLPLERLGEEIQSDEHGVNPPDANAWTMTL
jgi:hypothetical protein